MANDGQNHENEVWQKHYERWNAVHAKQRREQEQAWSGYQQRQQESNLNSKNKQDFLGHTRSNLPSSGLNAGQQQKAVGYNNKWRNALRSKAQAGMNDQSQDFGGQQGSAAQQMPGRSMQAAGQGDQHNAPQEQQRMQQLAQARNSMRNAEKRVQQIKKIEQAMKTVKWGFRLGEAEGILSVIGALPALVAANLQWIFGNLFHGRMLFPVPRLSKIETGTMFGANLLILFALLMIAAPFVIAFVVMSKFPNFLQFVPQYLISHYSQ